MKNAISAMLLAILISTSLSVGFAQQGTEKPKSKTPADERKSEGSTATAVVPTSASPAKPDTTPSPTPREGTVKSAPVAADSPASVTSETPAKPVAPDQQLASDIYRVGVGDILDVRLLNSATTRSTLFTVIAGGLIDLPIAGGPIKVAGLTAEEIQGRIAAELKRRAVLDGAQVSVAVRQFASHSVVITGLVVNPGTKFLRREAVPLYVVLAESQLRNDAGRVVIIRAGTTGPTLDLSDPSTLNVSVMAGDVISVSARPQEFYYIGGRINYPGQKTFQSGITLLQAILAAGGTPRNENVVEISREGANGRLVTTPFNIKEIKSGIVGDPKLKPGDRIQVLK